MPCLAQPSPIWRSAYLRRPRLPRSLHRRIHTTASGNGRRLKASLAILSWSGLWIVSGCSMISRLSFKSLAFCSGVVWLLGSGVSNARAAVVPIVRTLVPSRL
jgi:hypothetical protein